jgi:hypothetical protein
MYNKLTKEEDFMYEEKEINFKKRKRIKNVNNKLLFKPKKYNNNILNKINWKQLFIRLLILFLIMILIIFTISRISKHNEKQNYNTNKNIEVITNAALDMYNKDNLPQNVGDSSSILLDELIKNDLIDEINDDNGNVCNSIESYLIVTKYSKEEYHLKIHLKCSKTEKNVEKVINCNQTCIITK